MSQNETTRRRHEWLFPDAPSPRQCRWCLRSETEIGATSQTQEIGFCEGPPAMNQTTLEAELMRRFWLLFDAARRLCEQDTPATWAALYAAVAAIPESQHP